MKWISLPNPYKYLAYGLAAVLVLGSVYGAGWHKATVKCEKEKTELAEKKAAEIEAEVNKRVPQIQKKEKDAAKRQAVIDSAKEKVNEAVENRTDNPACALSDAERDAFNRLSESTRR